MSRLICLLSFPEFQRQTLRLLTIINTRVQELSENVESLLRQQPSSSKSGNDSSEQLEELQNVISLFPLNDEHLEKVETYLKSDDARRGLLVINVLMNSYNINQNIKFQTKNELAVLYSWEGAKKKRPMKTLQLASTIISNFLLYLD